MSFEIVNYNENLPFKICITNSKNHDYHWHKEIELILLLKGKITYEIKNTKHEVLEKDIFLANSLDIHSISSNCESIILLFQIDPTFFDKYYSGFSKLYFEFNDTLNNVNTELYYKVRSNLAKIMFSLIKQDTTYKLSAINLAINTILIILKSFSSKPREENSYSLLNERVFEILNFIDKNYNIDISLNSISKKILISPQYISKIFKNSLGINFIDYIHKLRIKKSLNDLLNTNKSILDISLEHGFNDHKAYNRVFKKEFNMSPTDYRKDFLLNISESNLSDNYDETNKNFKYLYKFIDKNAATPSTFSNSRSHININVDFTIAKKTKYKKYWKITSIGRAALCLRHEIRKQITLAQRDIGYEFIRFHGIFSDEMLVYKENSKGEPIYNWNYIDEIFDFFYEVKLKPFIEIGFMPLALASKKQYAAFFWQANVSYPKSIDKWKALVSAFIKHCIERYSISEVSKWYFDIWTGPDFENAFWFEGKDKFFKFYKETYFSIKNVSPNLKVGSPGILPNKNSNWFKDFLFYCNDNKILLDFISCHIYATTDPKNIEIPKQVLNLANTSYTLSDENFLETAVAFIKNTIKNNTSNNPSLIVTEWNLSPYTRDYTRDTCFLSSYIIFNLLKNLGNIDAITFWTLSDIVEEGTTDNRLFHGGLGLFTYNGLKKPSYNAFFLLNKLGHNLIQLGDNYIVTSKSNDLQVIIYNFTYFDELFRTGDKSLLSYHERYNIFKASQEKEVNLALNLNSGNYRIKRSSLNMNFGSIFDAWIKMGAPEEIHSDVYNFLKSREAPSINISTENVKNTLILNDSIPIHGILLIEIHKLD